MSKFTEDDLISRGHSPGPHMERCLEIINDGFYSMAEIDNIVKHYAPSDFLFSVLKDRR